MSLNISSTEKTPALRQSSLNAWITCRAKYYGQYVLGLRLGDGDPNLEFGTMLHKQVEHYHQGKPYDVELLKPYTDEFPAVPEDDQCEVPFSVPLIHPGSGQSLPWILTGTIDRINALSGLYDLKTTRYSISQAAIDNPLVGYGLQATTYLYAAWTDQWRLGAGEIKLVDLQPKPMSFIIWRKDLRANGERFPVKTITTTRNFADFADFWELCRRVIAQIEQETVFPCSCRNQEHAWLSNPEIY